VDDFEFLLNHSPLEQHQIFHMVRVREHIHRLNSGNLVHFVHPGQIAGLSSRIAAY